MRRVKRIPVAIVLLYLFSAMLGSQIYWRISYDNQIAINNAKLNRFSAQLTSLLEKYTYIPRLLSKDSELINALKSPDNPAQIEIGNRYLQNVNQIIEASDTYLLDINGTTLATSNWQKESSFLGRNFAFRPYFQQAIQGQQGQYFALGATSGSRGFYYSFPITYGTEVLGVIVVKTNLEDIEKDWADNNSYFLVSDEDGVIFMSSDPKWLYKSFTPLPDAKKQSIRQSQRYLDKEIVSLGLTETRASGSAPENTSEFNRNNYTLAPYKGTYLSSNGSVDFQNMVVRVLSPKTEVFWTTFGFVVLLSMIFALILTGWLLVEGYRIRKKQVAHFEEEIKQRLEYQVMKRTAALQLEIQERQKTEAALRRTQEELIQAAKLAVLGEMSASISHELNNPLAAIRSFAENGKKFLDKGQPEKTTENLTRISALTDRMAKISQQLKAFSRKSASEELVVTQVQPVVTSALDLMKTRLRSEQVQVEPLIAGSEARAKINTVQLGQVLVNLISNAIEAMSDSDNKTLRIMLYQENNHVKLSIEDSGSGIPKEMTSQLFKPFYTTKQDGLGLGLSISLQIIKSMDGELITEDSELGGARFVISMPAE